VTYTGKIWISKDGTPKIKVVYTSGINQEILVIGNSIKIADHSSGKEYTHSMSGVPLYAILIGEQGLSPEGVDILEESEATVVIRIVTRAGDTIVLTFGKYELTGNIANILGWRIGEGSKQTEFRFIGESIRVGDKKQIPGGTFVISSDKP
jgi:hypothetical protein